ncbi:hypothetical protein DNP62_25035, partial [Salmonella enterica subsp. enterica serovar Panama]
MGQCLWQITVPGLLLLPAIAQLARQGGIFQSGFARLLQRSPRQLRAGVAVVQLLAFTIEDANLHIGAFVHQVQA